MTLTKRFFSMQLNYKNALQNIHSQFNAQMVTLSGIKMPSSYANSGPDQENLHTRKFCSLFDYSHKEIIKVFGKERDDFLESICFSDLKDLEVNNSVFSAALNSHGGILFDMIITKFIDHYSIIVDHFVINKVLTYFNDFISDNHNYQGVSFLLRSDQSLFSLEGPCSQEIIQTLVHFNINTINFMNSVIIENKQIDSEMMLLRCGCSGEDGFIISLPFEKAEKLATIILNECLEEEKPVAKLAGMLALESLRVEAGICQYSKELDEMISPFEAPLKLFLGKRRMKEGGFVGYNIIKNQLVNGVCLKRAGFVSGREFFPEGSQIVVNVNEYIGKVTSSVYSPNLKDYIGMGYFKIPFNKKNQEIKGKIGEKIVNFTIVSCPFIERRIYNT